MSVFSWNTGKQQLKTLYTTAQLTHSHQHHSMHPTPHQYNWTTFTVTSSHALVWLCRGGNLDRINDLALYHYCYCMQETNTSCLMQICSLLWGELNPGPVCHTTRQIMVLKMLHRVGGEEHFWINRNLVVYTCRSHCCQFGQHIQSENMIRTLTFIGKMWSNRVELLSWMWCSQNFDSVPFWCISAGNGLLGWSRWKPDGN